MSEPVKKQKKGISDAERLKEKQILARIIIEVLGAPKEHVESAIKIVIDKLYGLKELDIVSESTYEAEERGKLFSTFSELEIWFKDLDTLSKFIFDVTPSSVEIIQPSSLSLSASFVSGFFNDFLLKLHDLGLKFKDSSAKTKLLQKNTDALMRNFLNFTLSKPASSETVSKITGIPKENVEAILLNFEKAGIVKKEKDIYSLVKSKSKQ
jgi:hypothetical protein